MRNSSLPFPSARPLLALALLASFAGAATAGSTSADSWVPSAEEEAVYRALSVRDRGPTCEAVEAMAKEPVATLISVAEHATMPPWVGVKATECLTVRHAEAAKDTLSAWMVDPERRGLALVIANRTADMPEPVAVQLATAGLAGPHAAELQKRLAKSPWASVATLANGANPAK